MSSIDARFPSAVAATGPVASVTAPAAPGRGELPSSPTTVPTLYEPALVSPPLGEAKLLGSVNVASFSDHFSRGAFDFRRDLTPRDRLVLQRAGITESSLLSGADADGWLVAGSSTSARLFSLVERLADRDGHTNTLGLGAGDALSLSGEVVNILEQRFVPFERIGGRELTSQNARLAPVGASAVALRVRALRRGDCFDSALRMIHDFDANAVAHLLPWVSALQIAREETASGRINAFRSDLEDGVRYIDAALQRGRPVLVGVSLGGSFDKNRDQITDHFVVVTGRFTDAEGRLCYRFADTVNGNNTVDNVFYVHADSGLLFKPRSSGVDPGPMYYEVTQVRRYDDIPDSDPIDG